MNSKSYANKQKLVTFLILESKELEKNERYGMHITSSIILAPSMGDLGTVTQANFTVGARESLKKTQFEDRLCLLGATNSKARDKI